MPVRIQHSRAKGWRMPEGAVYVGRPSQWGNPYRVGDADPLLLNPMEAADTVFWFRASLGLEGNDSAAWMLADLDPTFAIGAEDRRAEIQRALASKDLACWCRLCPAHHDGKPFGVECPDCGPCHADTLGRIANGFACEAVRQGDLT